MNNSDNRSFLHQAFRIGTPECAVLCAGVAMVLGLLFLLIGFWKTLLLFCLMLVGAFIGGVEDKRQWLGDLLNSLVPPRPAVTAREPRHGAGRTTRRPAPEPEETEPEAFEEEEYADEEAQE